MTEMSCMGIVNPAMVSTLRFYDRNELYGYSESGNVRFYDRNELYGYSEPGNGEYTKVLLLKWVVWV